MFTNIHKCVPSSEALRLGCLLTPSGETAQGTPCICTRALREPEAEAAQLPELRPLLPVTAWGSEGA